MLRYRTQGIATVFLKRNVEENIPTTIEDLRAHLRDVPDTQLANELMHFGFSIRGTRLYWNIWHSELKDTIHQLGPPFLFFTLSAIDF